MSLIRRKVRGTFLSTDGKRLRGRVTFTPAVTVYDAAGNVVLMKRPISANPDADGLVEVELPITDDPRHTPTGWFYTVTEAFEDGPSRAQYWIEVPDGVDPIPLADAITDQIAPKPDYALIPGPQGIAATIEVGSVTTFTPNQNPTVTNSGTENDAVLDFGLPRARNVTVGPTTLLNNNQNPSAAETTLGTGDKRIDFSLPRAKNVEVGTVSTVNPDQPPTVTDTGTVNTTTLAFQLPRAPSVTVEDVTVVNPDQPPTITDVGSDGDVELEFEIPRAPSVTVGTVTTVAPTDPADVVDVGSDGDVVLDFDIPQGVKGDPGDGVETPIGADGTLLQADSGTSSGTSWTADIQVDSIQFDTTLNDDPVTGQLAWSTEDGTIDLGLNGGNVVLPVGQKMLYRVKNQTGSPIAKGTLCAFAGTLGASGTILAAPADLSVVGPDFVMGPAAEDIANGDDGFVVHFGKLRQIDTSAFAAGDILWADPTTPGGYVNVRPEDPAGDVQVAAVLRADATTGAIVVRPRVFAPEPDPGVSLGLVLALGG